MGEGLVIYGRTLPRGVVLAVKSLIVLACVLFVVLPQLVSSFAASHRYAGDRESESIATNNALESARCARETGRWLLLICEKDRSVPLSAEDPGQTLLVTLCAGVWAMGHGVGQPRRITGMLMILALAVFASQSSRLIVTARNSAYSIDGSQFPATHGMSHTLYIGLGAVPNKFGLRYTDDVGLEAASAEVPGINQMST